MRTRSFPAHLIRLWLDPRVSRQKKIAFPLIVAAYWVLPDLMPFLPLDDVLFTAIMTYWFASSAGKDAGQEEVKGNSPPRGRGNYVDAEGETVDDRDN